MSLPGELTGERQGMTFILSRQKRRSRLVKLTSCELFVPKNMVTNANQITMVVYIVKPINLDSLKFSGILRVLTAYTVQVVIKIILYTRLMMKLLPFARHLSITSSRLPSGESARIPGGSKMNQTMVRKICLLLISVSVHLADWSVLLIDWRTHLNNNENSRDNHLRFGTYKTGPFGWFSRTIEYARNAVRLDQQRSVH